jgi:hypothetical protein
MQVDRTHRNDELALLREAHALRWHRARNENGGYAVDAVALAREAPEGMTVPERQICSACGYSEEWNSSDFVMASDITTLVQATQFHSVACAIEFCTRALSATPHAFVLPEVVRRIQAAFAASHVEKRPTMEKETETMCFE